MKRQVIPQSVFHEVGKDPDRAVMTLQDAVETTRSSANRVPHIQKGFLFKGDLANGTNRIAHKLGRAPQGWIVTRMIGTFGQIYETTSDDRLITLQCSSTPYVEIWFY